MTDTLENKALNLSFLFLKFRPRTQKELETYLLKKKKHYHLTKKIVQTVIQKLKKQNLIDDERFIEWFVERKSSHKPKSQFVIVRELLSHGIERSLIDTYFSKHTVNEEELAKKAILPRWNRLKQLSKDKRFTKAVSFLARRGFSYDTIKKTITELESS